MIIKIVAFKLILLINHIARINIYKINYYKQNKTYLFKNKK
jgi:hypothetical protein